MVALGTMERRERREGKGQPWQRRESSWGYYTNGNPQQRAPLANFSPTVVRTSDIILVLVAILFPPAAAGFLTGCSCDLLINIALTCALSLSPEPNPR